MRNAPVTCSDSEVGLRTPTPLVPPAPVRTSSRPSPMRTGPSMGGVRPALAVDVGMRRGVTPMVRASVEQSIHVPVMLRDKGGGGEGASAAAASRTETSASSEDCVSATETGHEVELPPHRRGLWRART